MAAMSWKTRVGLFAQRFWQPTSACMTCMPGSLTRILDGGHWLIALQTGLVTGVLAVSLTFTPAASLFANRYGNAAIVGGLTFLGDVYAHAHHDGVRLEESGRTALVSGLLALVAFYVLEDRARRVRSAWAAVTGRLHG